MQKLNPNAIPYNPATATATTVPLFPHHPPSPIFLQTCFYYHPSPYVPPTPNTYSHNFHCYVPRPPLPHLLSQSDLQESDRLGGLDDQTTPMVSFSARCFARGPRRLNRSSQKGSCSRFFWIPKVSSSERKSFAVVAPPPDFEFKEAAAGKTTVMLKNIPNKFSKQEILDLLDEHCRRENSKILEEGSAADSQLSEFDFLYLPMDFLSGSNLGYAFVNFTSTVAASRLHREMHKKPWNVYGSRKVSEVTHAKIQGSEGLLKHFKSSIFACCSPEYLPVYFYPSRDGFRRTKERLVGKLVYQQAP
ncbi:protein MEI2-like 6 [Dendrobium catenatum]|nr:protein MEI2-like 6 [Dendrobium catenatum]